MIWKELVIGWVFVLLNSKRVSLIIAIVICSIIVLWFGRVQISEFLSTYFLSPLGRSYNPINSAVYALLLFSAIYLLSRVLPRLNVEIDEKLIIALLPFILLGSCLRVFQDAQIVNSVFLVSPFIYLVVFAYTFVCLLLSLLLAEKTRIGFHYPLFIFGIVPAAYFVSHLILHIINLESILLTLAFAAVACFVAFVAFYGLNRFAKFDKFRLDLGVVFSQMLDVSATFVGVTFYGYGEQHFLVRLVADVFGSVIVFYLIDFVGVVLILLVLERVLKKEQALLGLFRLTLVVLGLAPALRDILRVALLT